jgi:hypothetical protein
LLCAFSCTSSATDQLLHEVKKIFLDPKSTMLINDATSAALKTVLDVVLGPQWDLTAPIIHEAPTIDAANNLPSAGADDDGRVDDIEENVKLLTSGTISDDEMVLKGQTLSDEVLRRYLEKIGIKPVKDRKNVEASRRPYVLWNKSRLIDACISKFGGKKSNYNSYDNNNLIHRLATYQSHPSNHRQTPNSRSPPAASNVRASLLQRIFASCFLPKLTAKGREYCKMGHTLELPFAWKLLQHSKEGLTKFQVEDIFHVGLVGKRGRPYAKESCDLITVISINGEKN